MFFIHLIKTSNVQNVSQLGAVTKIKKLKYEGLVLYHCPPISV